MTTILLGLLLALGGVVVAGGVLWNLYRDDQGRVLPARTCGGCRWWMPPAEGGETGECWQPRRREIAQADRADPACPHWLALPQEWSGWSDFTRRVVLRVEMRER